MEIEEEKEIVKAIRFSADEFAEVEAAMREMGFRQVAPFMYFVLRQFLQEQVATRKAGETMEKIMTETRETVELVGVEPVEAALKRLRRAETAERAEMAAALEKLKRGSAPEGDPVVPC